MLTHPACNCELPVDSPEDENQECDENTHRQQHDGEDNGVHDADADSHQTEGEQDVQVVRNQRVHLVLISGETAEDAAGRRCVEETHRTPQDLRGTSSLCSLRAFLHHTT